MENTAWDSEGSNAQWCIARLTNVVRIVRILDVNLCIFLSSGKCECFKCANFQLQILCVCHSTVCDGAWLDLVPRSHWLTLEMLMLHQTCFNWLHSLFLDLWRIGTVVLESIPLQSFLMLSLTNFAIDCPGTIAVAVDHLCKPVNSFIATLTELLMLLEQPSPCLFHLPSHYFSIGTDLTCNLHTISIRCHNCHSRHHGKCIEWKHGAMEAKNGA